MTHNIIGTEADRTGRGGAHVEIRTGRGRRASKGQVVAAHLIALCIGGGASLIDILVGQPIALGVVSIGFLAWCMWPTR
ncbi:MAG: hypothetical protein DI531_08010 [Brevundimonas sp.]|uniref:hypothetical protein n=1 Tax=Brevundimonas sp. TaxID=1871086 RepID=UPI000DB1E76B|nr:hypothetical protein [Brevundimonas sp.]PZU74106.1 MAG: hypothetical protein DI531_08010 [Brevundimonas sp.]